MHAALWIVPQAVCKRNSFLIFSVTANAFRLVGSSSSLYLYNCGSRVLAQSCYPVGRAWSYFLGCLPCLTLLSGQ